MGNDQTEKAELLIITDQVFDGSGIDSYFLEYRVDAGRVVCANSCVLNDSDELNLIADELIINYSDAIANLTAGNFTNKQNALLGRLFLFTDISTKRTEFLQSFDLLCNLLFLKKKFQSHQPQHIRIIGCNMMLKEIVQMTFPKSLVTVEHQSKYLSSRFRILLKNIVFFCRMLVVSLVLAVFRIKEHKFDERRLRVFLTRYPGRLSDAGQEQKYGHLVRPNDHYLASVLTDGLHQNLGFFNLFKRLNSAAATEKIILVDKYIRPLDAISGFWETLMDALKPINLQEPVLIEGIDLSPIINIEAQYSLLRLPRLVAIAKAYDRAFRHLGQQTTKLTAVYYLHEYAYGRMITTVLKKRHPNIRRIAMQHGPASPRKLVYAVSSRDWLDLLAPEVVLAEDQQSAALYRRFGYDRVSVMKQIPRLFVDRTASQKLPKPVAKKTLHLVAGGLHDSISLISTIKPQITANQSDYYYIKPHPKAPKQKRYFGDLPANCEITELPLLHLFQLVGTVHSTYSSVGLEALSAGLKVNFVNIPGRVSQRPDDVFETNAFGT